MNAINPPRLNRYVLVVTIAIFSLGGTSPLFARGRSFPIEVIGTVTTVNASRTRFTMRTDPPEKVLSLAIGENCKFKESGRLATDAVLKKGRRVRVNYFSTIFTGKIVVEVDADPVH